MYGLPKDSDLSFLLGKELIQICLGLHERMLHFYEDITITLECEVKVSNLKDDGGEACASCPGDAELLKILGSRITGVTNKGGGELALTFSNGSILMMFDSNSDYESYQISGPTGTIIV